MFFEADIVWRRWPRSLAEANVKIQEEATEEQTEVDALETTLHDDPRTEYAEVLRSQLQQEKDIITSDQSVTVYFMSLLYMYILPCLLFLSWTLFTLHKLRDENKNNRMKLLGVMTSLSGYLSSLPLTLSSISFQFLYRHITRYRAVATFSQ